MNNLEKALELYKQSDDLIGYIGVCCQKQDFQQVIIHDFWLIKYIGSNFEIYTYIKV